MLSKCLDPLKIGLYFWWWEKNDIKDILKCDSNSGWWGAKAASLLTYNWAH